MDAATEAQILETAQPFVGRWNRLVSTTNWEKGRIIWEWREAMNARDAPAGEYSDEAWSVRVSGVSPQHVGRLRRVWERFGDVHHEYEGLFWSHFQAALEFDDAEMWLEGAVQSGWSVAAMRRKRWETLGAPEEMMPRDEDIVVSELDEDASGNDDQTEGIVARSVSATVDEVRDPDAEEDDTSEAAAAEFVASADDEAGLEFRTSAPRVRPFEDLPTLPDDLADALETFKLAIVRHKLAGWQEVSRDDVLAALEALKTLALAPADE